MSMLSQRKHEFTIARTVKEIEAIRVPWESFQSHPNGDIDFFLNLIDFRKEIERPHVVLLQENGVPVSLIIGRIENVKFKIKIGYKELWDPKIKCLTISYGGILGNTNRRYAELLVEELIRALHEGEADAIIMGNLEVLSDIYTVSITLPKIPCRDFITTRSVHRVKSLVQTEGNFTKILSKTARSNYNNYANKLNKAYKDRYDIKCYRHHQDLDTIMKDCESIARNTYHRALDVGFHENEEYRRRFDLALRKEWLRVYILYIDGFPIAFWTGMLYKKTFHLGDTGYDSKFKSFSVGSYLLMKIMEYLSTTGDATLLDFGFGDAEYKRHLSDHCWEEAYVCIFSFSIRSISINLIRTIIHSISLATQYVVNRFGLETRLKAYWREKIRTNG
jgi:hypothetical protein